MTFTNSAAESAAGTVDSIISDDAIADLSPAEKRSRLAALLKQYIQQANQFPLSFAQQRLWFLDQLQPGSPAYTMMVAVRLRGRLQFTAFEQALQSLVQRHEALRTNFVLVDGQPYQRIHPVTHLSLPQIERIDLSAQWSTQSPEQQEQIIHAYVLRLAQQPFDLAHDQLVRSQILQLDADTHVMLLAMHHIVSDGWSMEVLIRELAVLYKAHLHDRAPDLPPLPIQYADFAVWQRQFLQGDVLTQQLDYWRSQLSPLSALPSLPTDFPRPAVRSHQGDRHGLAISATLTTKLQELSQQTDVTLFMTTLAAFKVLLYYYTQQSDIRVGTPVANRDRPEVANLIGFFTNTLVLRSEVSGHLTFRDLLQQVRDTAVGAYAHQDLPFEKLVEELQPQRTLAQTPLFQVWFYLQADPVTTVSFPDLTLEPLEVNLNTAKHDLKLGLWETAAGLSGALEYSTDLFESATVERLARHYEALLAQIASHPDDSLDQLVAHLRDLDQQAQTQQVQTLQSTPLQKLKRTRRQTHSSSHS